MKGQKRKERSPSVRQHYAQMIGKEFLVPASFFKIDVPGMFYKFRVIKKDNVHKNAMTVISLEDKGPKHWIPIPLIQGWILEDEKANPNKSCTNDESDWFAVECLLELKRMRPKQDVSDEESITGVLLSMSDRTKSARRTREMEIKSSYDLAECKGFLQLQATGKYKVRLEGDNESDEDQIQTRTDSSSVIVHKA